MSSTESRQEVNTIDSDEVWRTIALENIIHDVAQALGIDRKKIDRIKDIMFSVDERTIRRFEARARSILEQYLESAYGSLMSYYASMGLKGFMEPLIKKLKQDLMKCIADALRGGECDLKDLLERGRNELRQMFFKRRKAFMRIDFHDRRLKEITDKIFAELSKILDDYDRLKPAEKKFLDVCIDLAESIRDPISYYNIVWTYGFIFKALEFEEYEKHILLTLSRTFESLLKAFKDSMTKGRDYGLNFIRRISDAVKRIFLYVAYFPNLLRVSKFLDMLPRKPSDVEDRLADILVWLESDRSYGRLSEIIRERYEDEIKRIFSGRLPLDANKVIEILAGLEESLSSVERLELDVALQLIHSLLFHQKAIQYTLSLVKFYLLKHVQVALLRNIEELEKKISEWKPFYENPDILPNYIEDLVKEIHAYVDEKDVGVLGLKSLVEAIRAMPVLSISIVDVRYPDSLLAIGNYILAREKPGSAWETELLIVVNDKYRIRRKVWVERDIRDRVIIREKFVVGDTEAEYILKSYSMFKEKPYMKFLEGVLDGLYRDLEESKKKLLSLRETVELIDRALEKLMNFDAEGFHEILRVKRLSERIRIFLGPEFDKFLKHITRS